MDKALETMLANLEKNTGKSLAEWVALLRPQNFAKHGEIVSYLKTEHSFGHGFANLVAHEILQSHAGALAETTDLVADQYKSKELLRPIYDAIMAAVAGFGNDVEIAPKKGYVSLRRKKQFALVQPSTKNRLDLGLNIKGVAPVGQLEASGSFNAMCTHRVRLEQPADLSPEVIEWIKAAYDQAG
jgi:hypothetical protein